MGTTAMRRFAEVGEAITATTKKLQKTATVADYLKNLPVEEAAIAAVFLSGRPFPVWEETTLQVGGRSLWQLVAEISGSTDSELTKVYRQHGDLGSVAGEVLPEKKSNLTLSDVQRSFRRIAELRGSAAKNEEVRQLLTQAHPLEAKYILKIMTGDLRIGLKGSLVEEAVAKAFDTTMAEVQRANMLLGDIGETVRLAAEGKLLEAKMRLFHPLGFMLASPVESVEEGLSYFQEAAVEDKYDGIRAQAHIADGEVRLYSRTRDEITESFPELPSALAGLPGEAILDGEIVAWDYPTQPSQSPRIVDEPASARSPDRAEQVGRARPFSVLQQRLGRKKVSERMLGENPVAFLVFDVLYRSGELLLNRPLRERAQILDELLSHPRRIVPTSMKTGQTKLAFDDATGEPAEALIRAPMFRASSPEELEQLFLSARDRGNEGLMIKDLNSSYSPGKRGKSWLKMKRELATLDVVVTAVEYGHGKRIGVLSDYTFAVWHGDKLVNIGKAYSGLTDAEIAEMSRWFLEHTVKDEGFRLIVEPSVVLEVAFNNMMRSDRHESGFALRFPRIVRLRPDKLAEDADTLDRAREIFEQQK